MNIITSEAHFRQRVLKYSLKNGVTAASIRFKRSRQAIYEWKRKWDGKSWHSLVEKSHRPHHHPNEHTAEEIAQETFFKALKNIEKYDPQQNILTWLCTIAKNTWYSQCKKSKKYTDIADDLTTTDDNIIDTIIDSEDSMEILRVLHSLPEP